MQLNRQNQKMAASVQDVEQTTLRQTTYEFADRDANVAVSATRGEILHVVVEGSKHSMQT